MTNSNQLFTELVRSRYAPLKELGEINMSELSIKELNADKDVKSHLLNVDSSAIAQKLVELKREKNIDVRVVNGRLVAA